MTHQHFDITVDTEHPHIDGDGVFVGVMFDPVTKRRISTDEALRTVLAKETLVVDGHYAGIAVIDGVVHEFSDVGQLRRLYKTDATNPADGTAAPLRHVRYTTHLPGGPGPRSLNLRALANAWLPVMSFSRESMVVGTARCFPSSAQRPPSAPSLQNYPPCVLSLSGGFDSRTLLAWCIGEGVNVSTVSYGTPEMPDCRIAAAAAASVGVRHTFLNIDEIVRAMSLDDMLRVARQVALCSEGTYDFAHAMVVPSIAGMVQPSGLLIDGGFGGLLRGGLANTLRYQGRSALHSGEARQVLPYLVARRTDMFTTDAARSMNRLVEEDLQTALDGMGRCARGEERDWIDAFFRRWYVPGYVANPQGVYDAFLDSTMPFLHASTVDWVFGQPRKFRDHGRWFRSLITKHARELTSVPFVGKKSMYPWYAAGRPLVNALHARASHTPLMASSRFETTDHISNAVYRAMREPVDDLLHSQSVRDLGIWDVERIDTAVDKLAVYGFLQLTL